MMTRYLVTRMPYYGGRNGNPTHEVVETRDVVEAIRIFVGSDCHVLVNADSDQAWAATDHDCQEDREETHGDRIEWTATSEAHIREAVRLGGLNEFEPEDLKHFDT